jgi:ATP-binding cassette subfamily C (CFTR/MRP) protein 4
MVTYIGGGSQYTQWQAILLAIGLAISSLFLSTLMNFAFWNSTRTGMQAQCAFVALVYSKVLTVSSSALSSSKWTTGGISNMASNDSNRLYWAFTYGNFTWAAMMEFGLIAAMMSAEVGMGVLGMIAVVMLTVPLQFYFSSFAAEVQTAAVADTDSRTRMMNEVLKSIELVKLQAWEQPFMDKIIGVRNQEVNKYTTVEVSKAINTAIFLSAPLLSASAILAIYVFGMGMRLTVGQAFAIVAWMNMLNRSLTMLVNKHVFGVFIDSVLPLPFNIGACYCYCNFQFSRFLPLFICFTCYSHNFGGYVWSFIYVCICI